jgi:UPF0755 protein
MEESTQPTEETQVLLHRKSPFSKKAALCIVGVVLIACAFLYSYVFVPPHGFEVGVIQNIPSGSSLRSISRNFEEHHLIKSRALFEALVIAYGGEKHLLPGDYLFEKKLSVFEIAERISRGERNIAPIKITIPEGFTVEDITEIMDVKLSKFDKNTFLKLAQHDEGYLFPDTYFFFYNDTEQTVYERMKENYETKMQKMRPEFQKMGKTEHEVIVMASLIEREAKGDSDRELISGILANRLKKGMALQVDAAPETYDTKGLPEHPIANPGIESIKAALYPKASEYFFYLHGKDGEVHYARTFEEHRQNKFKYLR